MSDFRDPEAFFSASRHMAHLSEPDTALDLLRRAIDGGFFCYPTFAKDPWLDPLRKKSAFTKLLQDARKQHLEAAELFTRLHGDRTLGLS